MGALAVDPNRREDEAYNSALSPGNQGGLGVVAFVAAAVVALARSPVVSSLHAHRAFAFANTGTQI